jgi:tetratricopeptide (TPR) repeat protein
MDRLERDCSNGRAALAWSQTDSGDPTLGLRLAIALYPFWKVRGYLSEGRQWLQDTLSHVPDQTSVLVARAQACAAELARLQDDYADAEPRGQASWSLAHTLDDQAAMALALVPLGWTEYTRNNFTASRQKFEASLELFRALMNPGHIASVLHDLAYLLISQGDYSGALIHYKEELTLSRANDHTQGIFWALHGMGYIAEIQSEPQRAEKLYKQCLKLARELHHVDGIAVALSSLGSVARYRERYAQAMAYYQESERIWQKLGRKAVITLILRERGYIALRQDAIELAASFFTQSLLLAQDLGRTRSIVPTLVGLTAVACAIDEYEPAVRLLGATTTLLSKSSHVLAPIYRVDYDHSMNAAQTALDIVTFDQAWTARNRRCRGSSHKNAAAPPAGCATGRAPRFRAD